MIEILSFELNAYAKALRQIRHAEHVRRTVWIQAEL